MLFVFIIYLTPKLYIYYLDIRNLSKISKKFNSLLIFCIYFLYKMLMKNGGGGGN